MKIVSKESASHIVLLTTCSNYDFFKGEFIIIKNDTEYFKKLTDKFKELNTEFPTIVYLPIAYEFGVYKSKLELSKDVQIALGSVLFNERAVYVQMEDGDEFTEVAYDNDTYDGYDVESTTLEVHDTFIGLRAENSEGDNIQSTLFLIEQ